MKSSIYVTFDTNNSETGAGQVCFHEMEALGRVTNMNQIITKHQISPLIDQHYSFNPFLYDYFAAQLINKKADIAHLSCSPANAILERLQPTKYLVNIVAHELKTSIDEHERLYGQGSYPFAHNTDPYLHKILLKHAEKADVVLTPSKGSAKWIKKNINPKRIEVIPHGCNLPSKIEPLPERFRAGYIGAFGPDKGLVYLISAWNNRKYRDVELALAGDCAPALNQLIPTLNTNNAIFKVLGRVPSVTDFYNSLSVYIQPSVTEGFGMPVLEAMAHGRPVIVSEGAGASDLVEDDKEGFVVPIRSAKAIAEKIQYFVENFEEIKIWGDRARKKAEQYTWDKVEKMYESVYTSV